MVYNFYPNIHVYLRMASKYYRYLPILTLKVLYIVSTSSIFVSSDQSVSINIVDNLCKLTSFMTRDCLAIYLDLAKQATFVIKVLKIKNR